MLGRASDLYLLDESASLVIEIDPIQIMALARYGVFG